MVTKKAVTPDELNLLNNPPQDPNRGNLVYDENADELKIVGADGKWKSTNRVGSPVETAEDLRAIAPEDRSNKQMRFVKELGKWFQFDESAADADNGQTNIKPNDVTA